MKIENSKSSVKSSLELMLFQTCMISIYTKESKQNKTTKKFLFVKQSWEKSITVSIKNILKINTIVFNIDNNMKCFLSSKSAY